MTTLDFAKQKMLEASIKHYQVDTILVSIPANQGRVFGDNNDFYFSANMFSQGVVSGTIQTANMLLPLSPEIVNSQIAKIKAFKGSMKIFNKGDHPLFIEFLRVSPLSIFYSREH